MLPTANNVSMSAVKSQMLGTVCNLAMSGVDKEALMTGIMIVVCRSTTLLQLPVSVQ
jgi:hypothetical protein